MKIIDPWFKVESITPNLLEQIELAARNCYKSEEHIKEGSCERFIEKNIIGNKHFPILEFGHILVRIVCDRGITHEIVRHRIASYAQESTRYCNYSKDKFGNEITVIMPFWFSEFKDVDDFAYKKTIDMKEDKINRYKRFCNWKSICETAEEVYLVNSGLGGKPQEERNELPNSLKTEILVYASVREWRHIFYERAVNKRAHPQMRQIMIPLVMILKANFPVLFKDLFNSTELDFPIEYFAEDRSDWEELNKWQ